MAVRNLKGLGPRKNVKPIPVHVWIPPKFNPIYKIEIVGDETIDVTDIIIEGEYTDGVTGTIGEFEFTIDNSSQIYTNKFSLYNLIKIYLDYGGTASTLRFTGRIERISRQDNNLVLTGRSEAIRTIGKNITYSATNKATSEILKEIIEENFDYITMNNISDSSITSTVNYFEKPFWEIVEELCGASEYDAYIDINGDFHFFESGSINNESEAVVHKYNLISTGDFSPDLESVYNRVKVYGKETEGIPLIATAEDRSSQDDYDIKELKITDRNITTKEQAQNRADFELARQKDPPTIGEVHSLMLPTIQPGENIRISDPLNGLDPNTYQIRSFTHKFDNDEPPQTTLTVQKERSDIPQILKRRIEFETEATGNPNPNAMEYSIIYDFSSDIGSHSNTEIDTESQVLKTDGSSSGIWISQTNNTSTNVTGVEVRVKGENLSGTNVLISLDGGTSYTPINFSGQKEVVSGRDLRVKIEINSEDTRIKAVGILYK